MARWLKVMCLSIIAAASLTAATPPAVTLAVPGRANANASIAAAGDVVAVSWGAATASGSTDIYAAVSRDGGLTFAAPVRVSGPVADAQVSGEQPPRVTLVPRAQGDPAIVVVWTAKGAGGTRLATARSTDGGKSFGAVTTINGAEAAGNRGWQSITTASDGRVAAIWLDHRETVTAGTAAAPAHQHNGQAHTGHAASSDGAARAQLSKLYFGRVGGNEPPVVVTGGVCYCCKTSIAAGSDGALYAAWRHVYPGNIRDIAFTVSRDGGRTFASPVRISQDGWVLDGCPENGPAMAVGAAGRVHVVWPTLVGEGTTGTEPTLALFHATSSDGRRFTPRQRLDTQGTPYHPQIAVRDSDGSVLVVWDELQGGRRRAVAARATAGGSFTREEIAGAGLATHPVVAAVRQGFVIAWTDTSQSQARIVVQRDPS
jgi:hypothetical protein